MNCTNCPKLKGPERGWKATFVPSFFLSILKDVQLKLVTRYYCAKYFLLPVLSIQIGNRSSAVKTVLKYWNTTVQRSFVQETSRRYEALAICNPCNVMVIEPLYYNDNREVRIRLRSSVHLQWWPSLTGTSPWEALPEQPLFSPAKDARCLTLRVSTVAAGWGKLWQWGESIVVLVAVG